MEKFIVLQSPELKEIMIEAILEVQKREEKKQGEPLFTINQVRKRFKKSHRTIKKLVEAGILRSTPNGLIPLSAIEEYLEGKR
jgi:hypothetical protein